MTATSQKHTADEARAMLEESWSYYTPQRDTTPERQLDLFEYAEAA